MISCHSDSWKKREKRVENTRTFVGAIGGTVLVVALLALCAAVTRIEKRIEKLTMPAQLYGVRWCEVDLSHGGGWILRVARMPEGNTDEQGLTRTNKDKAQRGRDE